MDWTTLKAPMWTVSILAQVVLSVVGAAQTERSGQTAGGAHYKILVPDGWQPADGLVIWNHGFDLGPVGPVSDIGPLAALQLSEGYAVAASSFSLTGWAVFESHLDNQQMVEAFTDAFGRPNQILVYGASHGGLVTARDIEAGLLPNVVGALPICGAMAGSRNWDAAFDYRLIYDAVCGGVPGAEIPGGTTGLPFPPDPSFGEAELDEALNRCFGLLSNPTPAQGTRLDRFLGLTQIPPEFVHAAMEYATFGLADLLFDPRKLNGEQPLENANVDYGDSAINASIQRVASEPEARRRFIENYTPTGRVGGSKILSLHTDKDGLVIVENQTEYASVVPAGNLTVAVVVEDEPSHCSFTEAETVAAWEALRGWVAGLPQPSAEMVQNTCLAVVTGGLASGPCRFDPGFVVPDLGDRVRPRSTCVPDGQTLCLGAEGRFEVTVTWQDFQGNSGVAGVTDLRTQDTGTFWFFSPGNIELTVKALDARQINGRHWIFYGSLTNVAFELTVTDTQTGAVKVYENALGEFASLGDTDAFP